MKKYTKPTAGSANIWIFISLLIGFLVIGGAFALYYFKGGKQLTTKDIQSAEKIIGLNFTQKERKMMLDRLKRNLSSYEDLRKTELQNKIPPSLLFTPIIPGMSFEKEQRPFTYSTDIEIQIPANFEDLAFYPVTALAQLIKARKITSTQLTRLYLNRLKKYGPKLNCVITLTEDLALKQAQRADEEIESGHYRGPLHGIPWGAKDLLSTQGIKTTWGAAPYKDQILDEDATVVKRLEEAGAVLVAKLSMGALAMGDVWFEGTTKNPWNIEQGSSGSFDDLTRSGRDDLLKRQTSRAWPNAFRQARFIPAVEYIQANRLRSILMHKMTEKMKEIDVYVAPSFGSSNLTLTNLTGHPTLVVPNGFNEKESPTSISFIGNLFDEEKTLYVAKAFQDATDFHLKHPKLVTGN